MNTPNDNHNNTAKFCLGSTWDNALIDGIAQSGVIPKGAVHELFGALPLSVMGSGREADAVPTVSPTAAAAHIAYAHGHGMSFNYLLNAACLGNREYTARGHRELMSYLDSVAELRPDFVTVSHPFVAATIKREYPQIGVNVSTITHVDSVPKAKKWEDLGVDRITLSYMVNRDFPLLRSLVESVRVDLEVMANESCLFECAFRQHHYNVTAHGSQPGCAKMPPVCLVACTLLKMREPAEFIKARWIRPEDVTIYTELGIQHIKLAGREKSTAWLLSSIESYASGRSPADFTELLAVVLPDTALITGRPCKPPRISIDSRVLEGFLDPFVRGKNDCRTACGTRCRRCQDIAERAVSFDSQTQVANYVAELDRALSLATSREFSTVLEESLTAKCPADNGMQFAKAG